MATDPYRFVLKELDEVVSEKGTTRLSAILKDEQDAVIPAATLTTLTLTLYDLATGTIINSVNGTNILNTGRGAVDSSGNLTITLTPDDNPIVDVTKKREKHAAFLKWTWDSGAKAGSFKIIFKVENYEKTT